MSHYHRRLRAVYAGVLIAAAGCAGSQSWNATSYSERIVRLNVKNQFGEPVTVFAVGGGSPWRLGRVMALSAREFVVPNAILNGGPVEFVIAGEGFAPARSGPLLLSAGRVVDFNVTRPLFASTAIVRR